MVSISDFSFLLTSSTLIPAPPPHPFSLGIPSEARLGLRPESAGGPTLPTRETKEQSETAYRGVVGAVRAGGLGELEDWRTEGAGGLKG